MPTSQLSVARRGTRRPPASPAPRPVSSTRSGGQVIASSRPFVLLIAIVLAAGALTSRLVFWQVMEHPRLSAAAAAEHSALNVQQPLRGRILDALDNPLAADVTQNLVYAVPKSIKDPERTAALLSPVLGMPVKQLVDILAPGSEYAQLSPGVDEATSQKIRNLALPGIVLAPVVRRTYPEGTTAAQLLGYVDSNGKGNYGLEGYYDRLLSGTAGLRSVLKDTAGNDIHLSSGPVSPSHDGADLHLSLNGVVQGMAEDELHKAVTQHHADWGTVIVADPHTGYILGLASTPGFDPNRYYRPAYQNDLLDPAIYHLYEPGSTFKIITMAAGLDTGVITPQSAFDDTGSFVVGDRVLHNWNMSGFGWETMTQVLQHSANVGAAWVAQHLGTDLFYRYVKRFGFDRTTGIDLTPEQHSLLPLPGDKDWTTVNLYTNSFGQGLAVTPMQVVRAVGAVANGGVMMKPQVVKQIVYDGRIIDKPPVSQGRVISSRTAHTLTDMLVKSAIGGEAALGLVKGYNIAAKTGTANVPDGHGGYIPGDTIASIVGYAPAFHPRFLVLVIIGHPRDTPWGSMAAAPVLHNLFQDLFMYYHVPPPANAINK